MRNTVALLLTLIAANAAHAQPDVTYTPTSGTFPIKAQTAPSDADTLDTASVQIANDADGSALACINAGPDQVVTIPVTVPLAQLPMLVRARGWTGTGCTGEQTALSPNTGYMRLAVPDPPWLVP